MMRNPASHPSSRIARSLGAVASATTYTPADPRVTARLAASAAGRDLKATGTSCSPGRRFVMVLAPDTFRRLCRARAILCDLDGNGPAVGALAAHLGMSPFRLIRAFDAVFGLTPHQLRIVARVERAKHLLAADRPVTDVCIEVGFSSLGSFSSLFARRTGETPSGYRHRVRTMVQVPGTLPRALVPGCLDLMRRLPPLALRNSREA